jgi:ABC-2 type transport system ATP-binding protein
MDDAAVSVSGLDMTFRVPIREPGLGATLRSVVRRSYRRIDAVSDVSFSLRPGEVVGFIGPNGAGKTTTMKILAGILHPTGGDVRVLGFVPWRRRHDYLRRIALVRGSHPVGGPVELTVMDAFRYQQVLYGVSTEDFRATVDELTGMLDISALLDRQIRALSLGERMRTGLAVALLYRPSVLFLDEPSLGLDVSAAAVLRRFIADYAVLTGATVLLTSHYMVDVESLCGRVILIDGGCIRYDGSLRELAAEFAPDKIVRVTSADAGGVEWDHFGVVDTTRSIDQISLRVPRHAVPTVVGEILARVPVADLSVEEPPLEAVIDRLYRGVTR